MGISFGRSERGGSAASSRLTKAAATQEDFECLAQAEHGHMTFVEASAVVFECLTEDWVFLSQEIVGTNDPDCLLTVDSSDGLFFLYESVLGFRHIFLWQVVFFPYIVSICFNQ